MKLSIVIVHYNKVVDLINVLSSIAAQKIQASYEVVVIDNGSQNLCSVLPKNISNLRYVKVGMNTGYSQGNNIGVSLCNGNYVLILNPDTYLQPHSIDSMMKYLDSHKNVAVVTPMLQDEYGNQYLQIGPRRLGMMEGIVCLSFINKILPNNAISKRYFGSDLDWNISCDVEVFPGSVFLIRKKVYQDLGGFDERFFLYFEECDLSNRLIDHGWKIHYLASAKCIHYWGAKKNTNSTNSAHFRRSRYQYFLKYYGKPAATFVELVVRFSPRKLLYCMILSTLLMLLI